MRHESGGRIQGVGDEAEQGLAGALHAFGGIEAGHSVRQAVEFLEGNAGFEEVLGMGQRPELVVGGGDLVLGVFPASAPVGSRDLDGEEAGAMMVEEGGERVAKEGVDPRGEVFGDVGASEPPADDVAVLGLDEGVVVGAPGSRFGELADVELVEQTDDPVVDVLGAVVGMEAQHPEGEGGDESFEHRNQEVFGDPGDGRKLLVLGHFVDRVDDVGPLLAVAVAGVDGVDAHEAGAALRTGLRRTPMEEGAPRVLRTVVRARR